jgi:mRNA-degrading endonuclease RelE of RelBE toxin-antitoxin system
MNKFQIILTEHAVMDLKEIPEGLRGHIHFDLNTLESDPFPSGIRIKRLKSFHLPVYRLRSGDFRVLYHIQGNRVTILRVINRKLLDRVIRRLKASKR